MKEIIKYNLEQLFDRKYFLLIAFYLYIALFLSSPTFSPELIYNSKQLLSFFNLLLHTIVIFNIFIIVLENFDKNYYKGTFEIIFVRLNHRKILLSIIISYTLFYFLGFFIPFQLTSLLKQIYFGVSAIKYSEYIITVLSGVITIMLFWFMVIIILFLKLKEPLLTFIVSVILYLIFTIFSIETDFSTFAFTLTGEMLETENVIKTIIFFVLIKFSLIFFAYIFLAKVFLKIQKKGTSRRYKKGVGSKILKRLKFGLSEHHLYMLDLNKKKSLLFFSLTGLILLLILKNIDGINVNILIRIYLFCFVPILLSFNQYEIINIDFSSGIVDIIKLKKIPYNKIILNRWFVNLIFQIAFSLSLYILYGILTNEQNLNSIVFLIFLNVFYSSFNLLTSVIFQSNSVGNFLIAGFIYLFLRDDTQTFLSNFAVVQKFNFLLPVLRNQDMFVGLLNFVSLFLLISISLLTTNTIVKKY